MIFIHNNVRSIKNNSLHFLTSVARRDFFIKRAAYYSEFHSDEIFATMDSAKPHEINSEDTVHLRRSHFKFPEDGTEEEFNRIFKEIAEHIFHMNDLIQGYYPLAYARGSDRTECAEAFFVGSISDLDMMFDKNGELFKAHWAEASERKEIQDIQDKYITGVHGDYMYTVVPELVK